MEIKTVFMGSSEFSAKILKTLAKEYTIAEVITQPDKPAGRGKVLTPPPVKVLAEQLGLPVSQPIRLKAADVFEHLVSLAPDLVVVAAYGQILRQNVLDLPAFGCINVHASYLPRWRGAAPIQAAILNGDQYTGVTIMKMDAGIDTGPELAKEKVEITSADNSFSLSEKLAEVGTSLLMKTLPDYLTGKIQPVPQVETGATYASMIEKGDGVLDLSQPAEQLERKIRAYFDWPGTTLDWEGQVIKIRKVNVIPQPDTNPGIRGAWKGYPTMGTSNGELVLLEVQPPGKNWMSGADFLRGTRNWIQP